MSKINEVAPPGWGHTKAEKEKTNPDKPKSKIGGSAAAFKRALDDGRFKGLPGSTTKKEKTADMFKLMWAMKKKGDKPHYKPGTDKKYKKYQEEGTTMRDNNLFGNAYAGSRIGFKIDSGEHKKVSKKAKMRNLAKGNTNPNEKAAAEKKAGGPKLYGEGKRWDSYKKAVATVLSKKKEEKKPEKAMDAGARAKRKLQRKVHATYVSGSEDNVPDEMRD